MNQASNNDWVSFVQEVARQIRGGATTDELSAAFSGHRVRWVGTVYKLDFDLQAPGVSLDLPEVAVDLGHGRRTSVNGLHVPIDDSAIHAWSSVRIGDRVLFEATLGSGYAPFPPIEVQTLQTGRVLLSLRVCRGTLIERISKGA